MKRSIPSFRLYYDRELIGEIPLNSAEFVIGRKAGCHLRLLDASVSREHCKIELGADGTLSAEDLSSTNGTLVNNNRIIKQSISPNDRLTVGRCTLIFHDLAPSVFESNLSSFWSRLLGSAPRNRYSRPRGNYILPQDNLITQFDAVSYNMVHDQARADGTTKTLKTYLKRLPRLRVVASPDAGKEEVTRFSVSQNIFEEGDLPPLHLREQSLVVFAQPEVKGPLFRIPWKIVERVIVPSLLVIALVFVGRYFLSFHVDVQLKRAEKSWDQKLTAVAEHMRFADDRAFETANVRSLPTIKKGRAQPMSLDELWNRIDARPALRNFLLFQILDEVLAAEDIAWSLDEAIRNLSKIKSVTNRLPSVKKMRLVLVAEASPFNMEGMRAGKVLFLTDRPQKQSITKQYVGYKSKMTPRLAIVEKCAKARKSFAAGRVVLAFTVGSKGRMTSVFVNESQSTKEPALWRCVKETLFKLKLPPPPGGNLSIVYTFQFAPPTRVEF